MSQSEVCAMCGDPECETPVSLSFLEAQGMAIADEMRGVPPYTPTEEQPARCGQGE